MRRYLRLWMDAIAYVLIGAIVIFAWIAIIVIDTVINGYRKLKWI